MELRCESKILHAQVFPEEGYIETTCRSRWCGKIAGVVVIQRFDINTGELIQTRQYKEPEETTHGTGHQGVSVRSA